MVTEEIVKAAPPVFMRVACWALEAAPTVLEKVSVLGVSIGTGVATAVALKVSPSKRSVYESVVMNPDADSDPAVVGCTVKLKSHDAAGAIVVVVGDVIHAFAVVTW